MRLAASNIAWPAELDEPVAALLLELGFEGIEIAPSRSFGPPLEARPADVEAYRRRWAERGLPVVAMQALLFGRADLALFGDAPGRAALAQYLEAIIRLGRDVGATALVFGSPRNRLRGVLSEEAAREIAVPFFRRVGDYAASCGVALCIEPNPPEYGCDWITRADEALGLVREVDSPGFGLHLDAGALTFSGEGAPALARLAPAARHFHASEAQLAPLGSGTVDHEAMSRGLRAADYRGWGSVEMRAIQSPEPLGALRVALGEAARFYGDP